MAIPILLSDLIDRTKERKKERKKDKKKEEVIQGLMMVVSA
jgi:hypothetical protein